MTKATRTALIYEAPASPTRHMRALPTAALGLVLLAAGCVSPQGAVSTTSQTSAPTGTSGELNLTLLPSGKSANDTPTLDAPPVWRGGEWWRVKVTDAFDHKTYEGTRVVAGVERGAGATGVSGAGKEGAQYLVGMPRDAFSNELMVLHLPGFGQVAQDDLSFQVHNCPFEPVKFPLKDGLTWSTKFECRDFHAQAKVTSPTTAEIEMKNAGERMVLTYDAKVHEITKIVFDNYATLEVVDHGYSYAGVVTVPHMFHLVFQQSRTGPLLKGSSPDAPTDVVKVDPTYDRVSFVIILGSALPFVSPTAPDQAAGYYDEKVTAPDGKVYEASMLPHEAGLKLAYFMVARPGGDWTFQHVVAGPGIAVAEGIAYHVYDVDLPSGRVLPSTGTHHHGG